MNCTKIDENIIILLHPNNTAYDCFPYVQGSVIQYFYRCENHEIILFDTDVARFYTLLIFPARRFRRYHGNYHKWKKLNSFSRIFILVDYGFGA